ncbi:penicillin acylase family protein, partial [Vibrio parahaemolyticus]|uniref:penicillin acylase family protein n=1 Tax=Vibrio parahaemolyticus TaxID=670 RepID=UPI00211345D8
ALGLSFKWRAGVVFAAIADVLRDAPEHLRTILPRAPGAGETTALRLAGPPARDPRALGQALAFLGWDAPVAGSNAWIVGGGRSASGAPIL